ncbi:MAG: ethanolamine utilization protein [Burkholderiales bacterium]|nr:ethanolamine utilization protein [Burkholderiales bacterium]
MTSLLDQPFVFVDLETTGANAQRDRITEVGVVEWDGETATEWSALVNPGTPIPAFISRLTGITDAMVANAPPFAELAAPLMARLAGKVFVAHNARFDYGFLKHEFQRAGLDFRARVVCTVKLSKKLFPKEYKHNLDAVSARNELTVDGDRHRALTDARLIYLFLKKMRAERDADELAQLLDEISRPASLPQGVDAEQVESMPDSFGVYMLFDETGAALQVGHGSNVKKQLLALFAADQKKSNDRQLGHKVKRIDWISTAGELGALLTEARLLRELAPKHNAARQKTEELCSWHFEPNQDGSASPMLMYAHEPDFGRRGGQYGLYGTSREATHTLRKIAEANKLCLVALGLERSGRRPGSPCGNMQIGKCRGACVGKEPALTHQARLCAVLGKFALRTWPYRGRVALREQNEVSSAVDLHVFENWRYLGTARDEAELAGFAEQSTLPEFDADIYRILTRYLTAHPHPTLMPLDRPPAA